MSLPHHLFSLKNYQNRDSQSWKNFPVLRYLSTRDSPIGASYPGSRGILRRNGMYSTTVTGAFRKDSSIQVRPWSFCHIPFVLFTKWHYSREWDGIPRRCHCLINCSSETLLTFRSECSIRLIVFLHFDSKTSEPQSIIRSQSGERAQYDIPPNGVHKRVLSAWQLTTTFARNSSKVMAFIQETKWKGKLPTVTSGLRIPRNLTFP